MDTKQKMMIKETTFFAPCVSSPVLALNASPPTANALYVVVGRRKTEQNSEVAIFV